MTDDESRGRETRRETEARLRAVHDRLRRATAQVRQLVDAVGLERAEVEERLAATLDRLAETRPAEADRLHQLAARARDVAAKERQRHAGGDDDRAA